MRAIVLKVPQVQGNWSESMKELIEQWTEVTRGKEKF